MKRVFLYGIGCVSSGLLCGLVALIIAPAFSSEQPTVYTDDYVASIDPDIADLEEKIPSIAQLIVAPQFDDSWDAKVDRAYYDMRKMQVRLEGIHPPPKWNNDHDYLMDSISDCATSLDMLRGARDFYVASSSELLMDLCISGIERFKDRIDPFINR